MTMNLTTSSAAAAWLVLLVTTPTYAFTSPVSRTLPKTTLLQAKPKRLADNVDGVVYVNEKCINCATCSHFAPSVFSRAPKDHHHLVHHQPDSPLEVDQARAALAACPVAAIRVETQAERHHRGLEDLTEKEQELASAMALSSKVNNLDLPFPRPLTPNVYFVGYHNEGSFGATPWLTQVKSGDDLVWIMVDSPRFSKLSKDAVTSLTGPDGPDYLLLTHVDDVAGHNDWKKEFPKMKRIFHSGDLGPNNWIGDMTLENVEILLDSDSDDDDKLTMYSLNGQVIKDMEGHDAVILHTPGHSPGSISLYVKPKSSHVHPGVLFSGDTYGFTTRTNTMTGFPQYGNNLKKQAETLEKLLDYDWDVIAPGHGHHKDYTHVSDNEDVKREDIKTAISEMKQHPRW